RRVDHARAEILTCLRALAPVGRGVPRRRPVAFQVHVDNRVPLGLVHVHEHSVAEDARVVDEDVEPAVLLDRVRDEPPRAGEIRDVLVVGDGGGAELLDLCHHRLRSGGVASLAGEGRAEIVDDHTRPRAGECECVLAPDAAPGARDDCDLAVEQPHQIRSISVAVPSPPPQHMVTSPRSPPLRSSSWRSVVRRRAPVDPSGWPSAIAPPLTFTFSTSGSSSRSHAAMTDANASLISIRSRSAIVIPFRSRILRVAGIGPVSISTGSTPTVVWSTMRARALTPSRSAFARDISSTAEAPSETCDALPAVI